jgi:hypothetical protein
MTEYRKTQKKPRKSPLGSKFAVGDKVVSNNNLFFDSFTILTVITVFKQGEKEQYDVESPIKHKIYRVDSSYLRKVP